MVRSWQISVYGLLLCLVRSKEVQELPKVSIIIPTYNRATLIKEAINSVLQQTYSDFEILVVDDGSTDNTKEVMTEIENEKVQYIQLDRNYGACHARNVGIEKASGIYIAFQDSDDIWYRNKLEKQVDFLLEHNADMTFCQLLSTREGSDKKILHPSKNYKLTEIDFYETLKNFLGSTQTFLLKKECFDTVRFDEELPRYQDWEFLMQVARSYKIVYQPELLVVQRLGCDSISVNPQKGFIALEYLLKKYEKEYESCPKGKANILSYQATFLIQTGGYVESCFRNSLKAYPFSPKHWIKYFLYKIGILQYRYKAGGNLIGKNR